MSEDRNDTLWGAVGRAAWWLDREHERLSSGERAELRRASWREAHTPALWRMLWSLDDQWHEPSKAWIRDEGLNPEDKEAGRAEWERRWAGVFACLAHVGGRHSSKRSLGAALAAAGYAPARLERLLRLRDSEALWDEVQRAARYLAQKGQEEADWSDAARLLLWQRRERGEKARRRLARQYFGALYHQGRGESQETAQRQG